MRLESKVCCLRVLSAVCISLIWLIGAAILGFSLWFLLDVWIKEYVQAAPELLEYRIYVYLFIAGGSFILVFGVIGMIGAVKPNVVCLVVFLVFSVLLFLLLVVSVVLGFFYRVEVENTIQKSQLMTTIVRTQYGKVDAITSALDYMQVELHCCGGVSFEDYKGSDWVTVIDNTDAGVEANSKNTAPLSCCSSYWYIRASLTPDSKYCKMYKDSVLSSQRNEPTEEIYKTGCGEAIVDLLRDQFFIVCAVGISIIAVVLLTIVFLSLLIHYLRREPPMSMTDDVVYEMARCQEKSPYPTRGQGGPYANLYNN
ncbi:CD151 antigen-like [Mizuhopecten yessoensis]|uniref:Tetraspanin n=1 Tax=Mizuhopecten yessoensis TaxID=6573 RepID=A0A210QDF7_MIZYE|nr:CD151 antigen-like [Mizuhopecten yessoensis]OWF46752.1 CD82 antigen [Mizuhopecten yessoensis]